MSMLFTGLSSLSDVAIYCVHHYFQVTPAVLLGPVSQSVTKPYDYYLWQKVLFSNFKDKIYVTVQFRLWTDRTTVELNVSIFVLTNSSLYHVCGNI